MAKRTCWWFEEFAAELYVHFSGLRLCMVRIAMGRRGQQGNIRVMRAWYAQVFRWRSEEPAPTLLPKHLVVPALTAQIPAGDEQAKTRHQKKQSEERYPDGQQTEQAKTSAKADQYVTGNSHRVAVTVTALSREDRPAGRVPTQRFIRAVVMRVLETRSSEVDATHQIVHHLDKVVGRRFTGRGNQRFFLFLRLCR